MKKTFRKSVQDLLATRAGRLANLAGVFLVAGTLTLSASTYATEHMLSLNLKNATIREAIESIKSQSEFSFSLDVKDLNLDEKVSVSLDNKSINENGEIVENSDTKVTDYILMDKIGYYIISLNTQDASMCKVSLYNSDKSFLENKENFENGYIVLDITERRYMRLTIPTLANKIQLEFS